MGGVEGTRRHRRVRYRLPVGVLGRFEVFGGRTENLSAEGVCLQLERPVAEGSRFPVIMRLPTSERTFVVCGRVLWCRPEEGSSAVMKCGFQFLWLPAEARQSLEFFLGLLEDENGSSGGVGVKKGAGGKVET